MEKKLQNNISHILQFINSARFMASSLSNLVNNLSEGIHRIKCKYGPDDKKCESCGIEYKYFFLGYINFKDDLIEYKFLCCNTNYQRKFDEKLRERLFNTYKFCNQDNNKFISCCEKVFIFMKFWMIGKNSMKSHYLMI